LWLLIRPTFLGTNRRTRLTTISKRRNNADPDKVREELKRILAEARAAQSMPWDPKRAALYRTIFPQMTNWLPEDEGAQLRFQFEEELARLEAA
jgi:hypothetical protein